MALSQFLLVHTRITIAMTTLRPLSTSQLFKITRTLLWVLATAANTTDLVVVADAVITPQSVRDLFKDRNHVILAKSSLKFSALQCSLEIHPIELENPLVSCLIKI